MFDLTALLSSDVKKVIVAPLNWGLGHASRCIPIINYLLDNDIEVVLASDGSAGELLRLEFPQLHYEPLPSYNISYRSSSAFFLLLHNFPNMLKGIIKEHKTIKTLVNKHSPQLIISDNRFGLHHSSVNSVVISHQINLPISNTFVAYIANKVNNFLLNKFNQCWIPDDEDQKLSGKLSMPNGLNNYAFIGPLSRLPSVRVEVKKTIDVAIVLSGPEPARTVLESKLINLFIDQTMKVVLIRGCSESYKKAVPSHIEIHNMADQTFVSEVLKTSRYVISRSGYSSIMDYNKIGVSALLIPTPGQEEQVYLAKYLEGKNGFVYVRKVENILDYILEK